MRIAIITMWRNEEVFAPLFLRHYQDFADIYVLLDSDTSDNTEDICSDYGATVTPFTFPDGMNDRIKIDQYNKTAGSLEHDYVVGLDADEFIFKPVDLKAYIEKKRPDVQRVAFYQIYQHKDENPVNILDPVFKQRVHGDPSLDAWRSLYVKPCIKRRGLNAYWEPGCHTLMINEPNPAEGKLWIGAHWAMADVELAVKRRLATKNRQSQFNLSRGYTVHNHHVTEEEIRSACKAHENDPRIF